MTKRKAREFVVVEGAGTDDEKIVHRCARFPDALKWCTRYGKTINEVRAAGVDVMSVKDDGTLTTEI